MALETTSEMLIAVCILWSLLKYKFTWRKTSKICSQTVTIFTGLKIDTNSYPGFRWNGVDSLHISWNNATFWLLKKNEPILVVAEMCCTQPRTFRLPPLYCQKELGVHKKLGEDRTGTADLNQPYCMTL